MSPPQVLFASLGLNQAIRSGPQLTGREGLIFVLAQGALLSF